MTGMVTKPEGTCPVMYPHHGQEPPGHLPPGLVTIPDNAPPLKSSRKDSQVFNVFRGALAPDPSEVKNVLIFNGGREGGWGGGDFPGWSLNHGEVSGYVPPPNCSHVSVPVEILFSI